MKNMTTAAKNLIAQGFDQKMISIQKFNIICVVKYGKLDQFLLPPSKEDHLPPSNRPPLASVEIEVRQVAFIRNDVSVFHTIVSYEGKDYMLTGIYNGLKGSALVIGIQNDYHQFFGEWYLYTDVPSSKPDHFGEVLTSEQLRQRAAEMMKGTS